MNISDYCHHSISQITFLTIRPSVTMSFLDSIDKWAASDINNTSNKV